ncbi:Phosphatidylethanolamine N-methyltransferase [Tritonibacter mobilis]|uniref:Phosphatidylethanolamine N-methyltransferase n=1 Tax=Tritonibacter mobilis F1926 TaxID=1265309 RepID=A0A1B1A963_9RHOB|nr:class I SAM-dependent methyltransferase [Tritonibacter mobilis]MBW3244457.1 methyltransferase domain-containing protein [Epibacterium sp. DP7N7-1]ANP43081.1 phosphatidylethanolamine N-methyltransferase [Tritonibacter mobilis F1926]KJZ23152.1 phosphatidylethanolamine N-methyltransferase [Tritonibacter mobilis]MBU3034520.1 methyltransferase domain-containing protein [Tritonibacter mobilis]WHQ84737.1 class I SAM-dependent methyltransferase [Tritonibacter mobilis]
MKIEAVESSYARWAPVYDRTFGAVTDVGRRRAVSFINDRKGHVLEVGVGTGLSLPHYGPEVRITGVDFSAEMLAKAQRKVDALDLQKRVDLQRMDARELAFENASFDTIAAMHVLSVVPEPEKVMAEIARVLKPGGKVVITNHFAKTTGVMAGLERVAAPMANLIGWHSDFKMDTILQEPSLQIAELRKLPPLGMMTFLVLEKRVN